MEQIRRVNNTAVGQRNEQIADEAKIRHHFMTKSQRLRFFKTGSTLYCTSNLNNQNQLPKSGQHGQILNETSNKAKIEKEIDVLETMNIELEHNYENRTTSLLANNAKLKAQIQEKVFANAALKNDLRKLKGNSVDTKFDKTSVLGKPVIPSLKKPIRSGT
ncbi:hypothetical protein Tco_0588037 [Tanacetum coccineum]